MHIYSTVRLVESISFGHLRTSHSVIWCNFVRSFVYFEDLLPSILQPYLDAVVDSPVAPFGSPVAVCVKVSLPLAQGSSDLTLKGQATLGMEGKRPLAQSAARHPKIARSHKSRNYAPNFSLLSRFNPRSLTTLMLPGKSLAIHYSNMPHSG